MEVSDEESVTGPARTPDTDSEPEQPDPAAAPAAIAPYPGDIDDETEADLARLLDSSEQPDPAALRAGMEPYLGDIDRYMRSLEVRGFSIPLLVRSRVWRLFQRLCCLHFLGIEEAEG